MKQPKITKKQNNILKFITKYREKNEYSPSYKEIAEHFKIKVGTLQTVLSSLEKKGAITRVKGKYRTLKVVEHENK